MSLCPITSISTGINSLVIANSTSVDESSATITTISVSILLSSSTLTETSVSTFCLVTAISDKVLLDSNCCTFISASTNSLCVTKISPIINSFVIVNSVVLLLSSTLDIKTSASVSFP